MYHFNVPVTHFQWQTSCSTSQCENVKTKKRKWVIKLWNVHLSLCSQLGAAYISATTGAVVTALGLKSLATVIPVVPDIPDTDVMTCIWIWIYVQRSECVSLPHLCSVSLPSSVVLSPLLLLLLLTVSTFPLWDRGEVSEGKAIYLYFT